MQLGMTRSEGTYPLHSFNPHPARRPDATGRDGMAVIEPPCIGCFNPHPARRPDATCGAVIHVHWRWTHVSILIRPEGGCNLREGAMQLAAFPRFQSSSGQKAGCNDGGRPDSAMTESRSFNPHPARRPDATSRRWTGCNRIRPVSIPSGQKAGCNPTPGVTANAILPVSILIRPEGRMQRSHSRWVGSQLVNLVSILIRPEGRMQLSGDDTQR